MDDDLEQARYTLYQAAKASASAKPRAALSCAGGQRLEWGLEEGMGGVLQGGKGRQLIGYPPSPAPWAGPT